MKSHMSENTDQDLSGVAETLLMTLYIRAMESQRPDALIKDEKAVALVTNMSYDFDRIRQLKMDNDDKVGVILRNREFDRYVQDFLAHSPEAVVVHIGCGLDSRFERVDNGQVEWYDLDLPEVIEQRRRFIAFSPYLIRANNLRMAISKFGIRYRWGLRRGQELEKWGEGIRLLNEWGYFDEPEPRLDHIRWMRHIPFLARVMRVYHYRLGDARKDGDL